MFASLLTGPGLLVEFACRHQQPQWLPEPVAQHVTRHLTGLIWSIHCHLLLSDFQQLQRDSPPLFEVPEPVTHKKAVQDSVKVSKRTQFQEENDNGQG